MQNALLYYLQLIRAHGIHAWSENGKLMAEETYTTPDGKVHVEAKELPMDRQVILAWLGY